MSCGKDSDLTSPSCFHQCLLRLPKSPRSGHYSPASTQVKDPIRATCTRFKATDKLNAVVLCELTDVVDIPCLDQHVHQRVPSGAYVSGSELMSPSVAAYVVTAGVQIRQVTDVPFTDAGHNILEHSNIDSGNGWWHLVCIG